MAPRLTGTSPPATATALCTEAATAWRAAGTGAAWWGGQPPVHSCGQTGHTGRSCPGGFSTHRWHEKCGRYLCPPASSQSLPSPGALQHCEDGCQGAQHPTVSRGQRPAPSASCPGSPYQDWRCAVERAVPPGPCPAPQGLSSCLGVCVGPGLWDSGRDAFHGAAAPAPPLQKEQGPGQAPAPRVSPCPLSAPGGASPT